jgi:hypothetical protein
MVWHSALMLMIEAGGVINSRLMDCAMGRLTPQESQLMLTEKLGAAFEASSILFSGGDASKVIDNYRRHVAANALRLKVS